MAEETIATFPSAYYSGDNARFAAEPSGKAYVAYCEVMHGNRIDDVKSSALVVATREPSATTWTETSRQADACVTGKRVSMTVAGGVVRIVSSNDLDPKVTVVESAGATAFTKSEINVPTTSPLNIDANDGKIHIGFSDSTMAGKATIARVEGAALVSVGKAGFTKETALVAPKFRGGRLFGVLVNPVARGLEFAEFKN